jgi:hypothetical protein
MERKQGGRKGWEMKKIDVSDSDIRERRAEYALALKIETQASVSVRQMWRKLVAMLDELLERRAIK